jgi:hypothetical protein
MIKFMCPAGHTGFPYNNPGSSLPGLCGLRQILYHHSCCNSGTKNWLPTNRELDRRVVQKNLSGKFIIDHYIRSIQVSKVTPNRLSHVSRIT